MRVRTLELALLMIVMPLAGCSRSDVVPVTGSVTLDGEPVAQGQITLFPEGPTVPASGGEIRDGAYQLLSKPGKMRVDITAYRKTGKRDDEGTLISENYIPRRYNEQSELTVEVNADDENRFDFPLEK